MSAPLRLSLVVMLLLAAGPSAQPQAPVSDAQQTASPQAPAPQPRFRAGTTLVTVDAIVRDRDGRFVADLTPDEFEVLEDGKPQAIESFYVVTGGEVRAASAPAAVPPPASPRRVSPPAPPQVQRVFVLLFDQQHMAPGGFKRAQQAAASFLETDFQTGDVGGVVGGGTMVGHRLTSSREEIQAAVRSLQPSGDTRARQFDMLEWPRVTESELAQIAEGNREILRQLIERAKADLGPDTKLTSSMVEQMVMQKVGRVLRELQVAAQHTIRTLDALVDGLAAVPGRKTVVLLSDGFHYTEWSDMRQITERAARAAVRIYALDTRGLNRGSASSDIFDMPPHAAVNPAGDPVQFDMHLDAPNMLSVDTGGYLIHNENNFTKALDEIAADTSSYYVLGYAPTNSTFDGKFRRIAVRVKRPGLTVRARKGYLATPGLAAATPSPAAVPATAAPEPVQPAEPTPARTSAAVEGALAEALASASGAAPDIWSVLLPAPGAAGVTSAPRVTPSTARAAEAARLHETPARPLPDALAAEARMGWEAYQRGDVEAAKTALAPVAAEATAPPWVWYVLGWSHYALGEYAPAVAVWQRVLDADPAFEPVYFDLADAYLQQRAYDSALGLLRTAGARWPADAEILDAQGVIQTTVGALDDAMKSFEGALVVAPENETSHFNLARACELRYLRLVRAFEADPKTVAFDVKDRTRAAEEYRWIVEKGGSLAAAGTDGLRRVEPAQVKALDLSSPVTLASFDREQLGGVPYRLAWSPDGTRFYVRGIETDRQGRITTETHAVIRLSGGPWERPTGMPAWAADYWTWTSAKTAPWIPTLEIESSISHVAGWLNSPYHPERSSGIARNRLLLKGVVIGAAEGALVIPGLTFSWAPYAMGAIAFVDSGRHLKIVDQDGHTRGVPDTKDAFLPAWSPDGTRIAWLQKAGSDRYVIVAIDVREHN